jgi:GSCFA family
MNTFRTLLTIPKASVELSHQDKILAIGSCFAENIAQYFQKGRFHIETNPFGILYNPVSIAQGLELLYNDAAFPAHQIVQQGELWHSFLHHGSFGQLQRETLLEMIQDKLTENRTFAQTVNRLILTLGTANVFEYLPTGEIVANCHKIPNTQFRKRRLSLEECVNTFVSLFEKIKIQQPDIQIIMTVSPIRHIRDGIVENQRSKATLLLAAEQLSAKFDFVHYFPAYEILMDDLRDYRFYQKDMIHPNETAIDYIWEAFSASFFREKTKTILTEVEALNKLLSHRSLFPESKEYQIFLQKQIEQTNKLKEKYHFLNFPAL